MIEKGDIDRLVSELVTQYGRSENCVEDWLIEAGIEDEAHDHLVNQIVVMTVTENPLTGSPEEMTRQVIRNLAIGISMAFWLGWEANKQYGREQTQIQ